MTLNTPEMSGGAIVRTKFGCPSGDVETLDADRHAFTTHEITVEDSVTTIS